MSEHQKKMIAPIVVTVLVILYYVLYFGLIIWLLKETFILRILLGIIPLLLSGMMLYVCRQRIKEIQEGEEDDLSQY